MMVEVPSNVIILDQFIDVGIDGISVGSNDLTQLVLGIDRDSEALADTFDETQPRGDVGPSRLRLRRPARTELPLASAGKPQAFTPK